MSTLLYRTGDVEKKTGPTGPVASRGAANARSDSNGHDRPYHDNVTNLSGIAAFVKTLIGAQTDMQQTMEQTFRSIESTLKTRLQEMEHSPPTVNDDIAELSHNFEDLSL